MNRTALKVACVLVGLCFALPVHAGEAVADAPKQAGAAHYAAFEITGPVAETRPPVYLMETDEEAFHDLLRRIERAGADPALDGVVVRVSASVGGWARTQEVRGALARCHEAGKQVVCVLDGADNSAYYLAAGADRIVATPSAMLVLCGLRAEVVLAKGLLDKLRVQADVVQVGRYKGGADAFTRQTLSQPFRQSLEELVGDYYDQLRAGIAQGRGVSVSRADALLGGGPYSAQEALDKGLVDAVMFYDQVLDDLASGRADGMHMDEEYGRRRRPSVFEGGTLNLLQLLMQGARPAQEARETGPAIALVYAVGPIVADEGEDILALGEDVCSAGRFAAAVRRAADDADVRAIVVRIDSPGGSATASDQMWRELRLADARKPVVASLGDTAASGGYYIAAGAREIVADPGTLTGSIGVFGGKLVLSGLFDMIGLSVEAVEAGEGGGFMSSFEPFNAAQRRRLQDLIEATYGLFIERVAATRPGMSPADVRRVAEGHIWTGSQARERGLVDRLGGLRDALRRAKELAGIGPEEAVRVEVLPRPVSLVELVLFGPDPDARAPRLRVPTLLDDAPELRAYLAGLLCLRREAVLCLMPAAVFIR